MSPADLNLLRHPRQPWWAWRQHLGWGLLGMGGVLCAGAWLQAQGEGWRRELQQRSAQQAQWAAQQSQERQARERARLQAQQQTLWRKLHAQQTRVFALQAALQREAEQGLRLSHWQADGHKLLLQGQWPQTDDLPGLQARLGQALGQAWALQSLGTGASASALAWTLEAPWPATPTAATTTTSTTASTTGGKP